MTENGRQGVVNWATGSKYAPKLAECLKVSQGIKRIRSVLGRPSIAWILLASFGLFWFSDTIADPDLWGHIRFGQDTIRSRTIISQDAYSYRSGGQPWINHEWLSEVIFAATYDRGGTLGLNVLKCTICLSILAHCWNHLRRRGLGPLAIVLLLLLVCVPFRLGLGSIRPQIFSYLFFLILLLLLDEASAGRRAPVWTVPFLFALWVNIHGAVLAGVGILWLWIGLRFLDRRLRGADTPFTITSHAASEAILGAVCGLALFVNPFGGDLVHFLLRTATVPRPEISEWAPLGLISLPGMSFLTLLAIGIAGLAGSRRPRRPEQVLIFGVTAILPLIAARHYPLFALSMVVLCGEHIADVATRHRIATADRIAGSPAFAFLSLVVSLVFLGLTPGRLGCIRIEPFYFGFPSRAVAFLKECRVRGNMAVPFDWGEYVLWHLGPNIKVSMDGRRETVYTDEVYRQSWDFELGRGIWDAQLRATPTDLVLAPNGSPTTNLLSRTQGWTPLYQDSYCVIFVRDGYPDLNLIMGQSVPSHPDNGRGLCFPGPTTRDGR